VGEVGLQHVSNSPFILLFIFLILDMARSPALNPSSTPFFPGVSLAGKDEGGGSGLFRNANRHDQDRVSMTSSSLSVSSSEFHSIRSSPSPPQDDLDERDKDSAMPFGRSSSSIESSRGSPSFRSFESNRPYPTLESRLERERSLAAKVEPYLEGATPGAVEDSGITSAGGRSGRDSFFPHSAVAQPRGRFDTPPASADINGSKSVTLVNNLPPPISSASPSSSLDSASYFASSMDYLNFDAQLKASPVINEIVDRLVRYEKATREIQRDLSDVHQKINILLERSMANRAPEFKDPFAPGSMVNANGSRASIALAPHQLASNYMQNPLDPNQGPNGGGDDVGQISQRLHVLTSSVGQLLALQTQQIHASNAGLSNNPGIGGGLPQDISPNTILPHNSATLLGHGLPGPRGDLRNSPRPPAQPARTWSAGSLDLPPRSADTLGSMRQDALFRDKRRSTMAIPRRDSVGVCQEYRCFVESKLMVR
jgi:hypothetical protein